MQLAKYKTSLRKVILMILTMTLSLNPYAYAQKAPAAMEKEFNTIVASFKKNPTYSSAAKANQALWELNNKYPFVADNNEAAFSRKYEAFQLQMEEVTTATESLGSCAGSDPALQKKVMNIGDAFAASIAKTKPDETQVKSFKEMNTTSFANSCTSIKPGQVVTPKQLESYKSLQKAFNDYNAKYAGKSSAEREAMAWRERNNVKNIFDYPGKTIKEKSAAMEKEKKWKKSQQELIKKEVAIQEKSLVKVKGFAGSEVRNHIRDKFGFVMGVNEKKLTAEKLHLTLMAGNRENALRNYVYYSQRFDFSEEEDLTQYKDSRLRDMVGRQGDIMFQGPDWQNRQQLSDDEITRLGKVGAQEIEAYKKRGKSQKLSVDDVYTRLLPYLKDGGYIPPEDLNKPIQPLDPKEFSKAMKQIQLSSKSKPQNPQLKEMARSQAQQQRYNKMISNAEKGEVGFLLQSKDFDKYRKVGLSSLSKAQVMAMIKSSLKEKIQDTKDYSKNFIKKYQTTKNLWGDRGVEGLADIGKTLLYSSPTVIYDTIAKNPKLMGSMCLPLQYAAKEKNLELPSYVKFGGGLMSAVPAGGQVASFAVGTTFGIALAAEYRYRMAGQLEGDAKLAGLGNHYSRGQEEKRADKTELKRAAKAQTDQLSKDAVDIVKENAVFAGGGFVVGKGGKVATTMMNDAKRASELKKYSTVMQQKLGREVSEDQLKTMYNLEQKGISQTDNVKETRELLDVGFSDDEVNLLLKDGTPTRKPGALTAEKMIAEKNKNDDLLNHAKGNYNVEGKLNGGLHLESEARTFVSTLDAETAAMVEFKTLDNGVTHLILPKEALTKKARDAIKNAAKGGDGYYHLDPVTGKEFYGKTLFPASWTDREILAAKNYMAKFGIEEGQSASSKAIFIRGTFNGVKLKALRDPVTNKINTMYLQWNQ